MGRLAELFNDLRRRPGYYLGTTRGADFEDRINTRLHDLGYSRIIKADISDRSSFDQLKSLVLDQATVEVLPNILGYNRHFLFQPFGSQQYPDFLVLDRNCIVGIEVKFSKGKNGRPIWNSGLPRPNGIYIFGSYGRNDITYFRGADVVSLQDAKKLHGFFNHMKEHEMDFNCSHMQHQPHGFVAYIRKAFDQTRKYKRDAVLDYFTNPQRLTLEQAAIESLP